MQYLYSRRNKSNTVHFFHEMITHFTQLVYTANTYVCNYLHVKGDVDGIYRSHLSLSYESQMQICTAGISVYVHN